MIKLDDLQSMPRYLNEWTETQERTTPAFSKQLRKKLGLSQRVFARVLGVSEKTIEKWEQGKNPIKGAASRLLYLLDRYPEMVKEIYQFKKEDKVPIPESEYIEVPLIRSFEPIRWRVQESGSIYGETENKVPFELKEFYSSKIDLMKKNTDPYYRLEILTDQYRYEKENDQVELVFDVNLYEKEKVGELVFKGIILLHDDTLKQNFQSNMNVSEMFNDFFSVLFPYMREQISSITSHFAGGALILPMIDCRNIKLDQPLVLKLEQGNN